MDIGNLILDGPVLLNLKDNGVATITLNRPQSMNALNREMGDAFMRALDEIEKREEEVKVVVWTGAGKTFSGGGDIRMLLSTQNIADARETFRRAYIQNKRFYDLPIPVIVAVNGPVAGVSTGRCLAADIIIACEEAKFAANFANIGLLPDGGTSYFLYKKLGHHRTAEILFKGEILTAQQCLELGLFNKVVPYSELYTVVYELADRLARGPSLAYRYAKEILQSCANNDFDTIANMEIDYQVQCWSSNDFREGATAFMEKRRPQFKGN